MYLDHFNLHRFPFPNTADLDHFFEQGKRDIIIKALGYAILHEEGLTTVVGKIGVGKSTILRMLVKILPPTVETVVIDDPRLSPNEFLAAIARQLNLVTAKGKNSQDIRNILISYLTQRQLEQKRVVIIIDETQYISASVLEEIHMLSNLEKDEKRLLQWVLFGQPQMEEQLSGKAASPLKDRIINRIHLEPLSMEVNFRLSHSFLK